jgi:hypothetical protein
MPLLEEASYKRSVRNASPSPTRGIGWVVVFALVLACVAWWPALSAFPHTQTHDGKFFQKMVEVIRVSVQRYHELPLWNPFECGGVPLWDNPQGVAAAPLTFLNLIVGSTRAIELWYVLHTAAGVVCMWTLARGELGMSIQASLVSAAAWPLAGVNNMHFTGGHIVWVSYLYFPLAMYLWRRAEHDLWAAVGTGLIAALTMYEGGTYPLPYLAILLGTETLLRVWPPRRFVRILRASVVVVVVALCVGGARYLPVFDQLAHHHREIAPDADSLQWQTLKDMFLAREHGRGIAGQQYVWPEFGGYVGPILLTLSALGVSVFAGLAVDRIPTMLRKMKAQHREALRSTVMALAMIGVGDEMSIGENKLFDAKAWSQPGFDGPPTTFTTPPHTKLYMSQARSADEYPPDGHGGVTAPFLDAPQLNAPDLGCWEEWAFERDAPLWLGDVPQAKPFTSNVQVASVDRTPNTFTIAVNADGPGRLLLNSTYDRGWRADRGEVLEQGKMLAVDVPAGAYTLHVRYWPHGLTLGLVLTGLSTLALLALLVRSRRRPRPLDVSAPSET